MAHSPARRPNSRAVTAPVTATAASPPNSVSSETLNTSGQTANAAA